ncbi:hypothetical protein IL306_004619 [Fusarium sp. DS 682]|nr:hypothetical protein IL306_004619 [Fusarium sp. DS 682]
MIQDGLSFWGETRKRQAEDWRIQVLHRLSPHQDKFDMIWRRERRKGSVEWIFNERRFNNWKSTSSSSTLLLHGPMGSGKTVTMANITGKIWLSLTTQAQPFEAGQFAAASFFFQYLVPETLAPTTVLGSIAHQFLKSLKCPVDHPAIRNYPRESTGNDTDTIFDYMKTYLPRNCRYYLVLDGLDELDMDGACEVLQPLASLQTHLQLHICCSVRTESSVRRLTTQKLYDVKVMSISSAEKDREIESYIDGELLRRTLSQKLSPAHRKHVRDALVLGAQGMYLWVVLQLDSLFPLYGQNVTSYGDLKHILARLPSGLFDAFEAALARIMDRKHESRIFEIVAAAKRPLTKNELRSALNINPGVTLWDPSTLALDPDAMVYCYSAGLLQIDEEDDTVRFMHHSVLRHLLKDDPDANGHLVGLYEKNEPEQGSQEPLPDTQPSRSPNHSPQGNQKKHRQDRFLFSSHQADTTVGYICLTCLHLKPHDRRVRQSKKLVVNRKTCQMISKAAVPESLLLNLMITMLQGQTNKHETQNFDIARIMEDLSSAPSPTDMGEGLSFHNYAETYWLDHTSRACFDQKDEKTFHNLFVRLIRDNDPGLSFPWHVPQHSNSIMTWARSKCHSRLLYELLCRSTGPECESIVKAFSKIPACLFSGLRYNALLPADILCMFLLMDCCDALGVANLLSLGASPNEQSKDKSWIRWPPLNLAIRRMFECRCYEADVLRCLLQAGANPEGTDRVPPPILDVIRYSWGAWYQILFSHGARVSHTLEGFWGCRKSTHMGGLDLAMFRGADADAMIQDLVDSGASIEDYFREHRWPVRSREKHAYSGASRDTSVFSEEDDDWVTIQDAEFQQRDYLDSEDSTQADTRVLQWICRMKCDPNITSVNSITPLGLAVELQDYDIAKQLLRAGADPNLRYRYMGITLPLLSSAEKRDKNLVRLLICSGASLQKSLGRKTLINAAKEEFLQTNSLLSLGFGGIFCLALGDDGEDEQSSAAVPSALATIAEAVGQPGPDLNDYERERLRFANELFSREIRELLALLSS